MFKITSNFRRYPKQSWIRHRKVVAINYKENSKQYRHIKRKLSSLKLTHDKRGAIGKTFDVKGIPNLFIIGKMASFYLIILVMVFHQLIK